MLKQRLLVAIPLIFIVIALLYTVSTLVFGVIASLILFYAGWEWSALAGMRSVFARSVFLLLLVAFSCLIAAMPAWWLPILGVTLVCWLIVLLGCLSYPSPTREWSKGVSARAAFGLLCLPVAWWSLITLFHEWGGTLVLFFLVLVWGADTGAYAIGRCCGKTPLLPQVSPKKTWEGLFGGFLTTVIIGGVFACIIPTILPETLSLILLLIATFLFSVLGDLAESLLKRESGVKDSGQLLPGHGGLLDRIDSMIAAAPMFLACLWWMHPMVTAGNML